MPSNNKEILDNKDLLRDVYEGISSASNIITKTMGPNGGLVYVEDNYDSFFCTKDGYVLSTHLGGTKNQASGLGVKLVQELCEKINEKVGDGNTTSTCFFNDLTNRLTILKNSFTKGDLIDALNYINENKDPLIQLIKVDNNLTNIKHVAKVACNGDGEIADIIIEIINKDFNNIIVEESNNGRTYSEIKEGFVFNQGPINEAFFYKNKDLKRFIITKENCKILIFDGKINSYSNFIEIFKDISKQATSIVIVADDFSQDFTNFVITNLLASPPYTSLDCYCIKAPGISTRKKDF